MAGPLPLTGFFRLQERFDRLGRFGIAVRGRSHSALLFSRVPIRQLDKAAIAVTEETSTTVCLLRLILEQRYNVHPSTYQWGKSPQTDAVLLIGDEALRFRHTNSQYPYETDLAFEWWLWQHLPFVFAVWAIRKDAQAKDKKRLELALARSLAMSLGDLTSISQGHAAALGVPQAELDTYLGNFVYRLGQPEEEGIARFAQLVNEHHLL